MLDKPLGMSSNQALQKVKWIFNAKKAGHTGSLDPLATGLLPLCFGQATKVTQYLLDSHKKYRTVIRLGETTDTLDSEGEVLETRPVKVTTAQIETAVGQFRGQIKQVPPMYSALKKDGQPLYKLARKGQTIERPARDMTVYSLIAKQIDERHLELQVHCSSGFYIRSLASDIGEALDCGAHVIELRRTDIKSISVREAVSLDYLESASLESVLQPIDSLLSDMPKLEISDQQALSLSQGKVTPAQGIQTEELTRFYTPDKCLFGVGEVNLGGELKTHRMFIDVD